MIFPPRRKTRTLNIGNIRVGGDAPITVQSMTNTKTKDVTNTLKQIHQLVEAGCEIVRVAVPDYETIPALKQIKAKIKIPLIADIHFNYRLALKCLDLGVDGLRVNPGNLGGKYQFLQVINVAKSSRTPIRIGVNSGSLEKDIMEKYGGITSEALVESALRYIGWAEKSGFEELKISLKSPEVPLMVSAYRLLARNTDYPFHLGVTEAGTPVAGTVKSSLGIGILLTEGIGDTIRVSLTGDPVREVQVGFEILKALKLRSKGVEIISCPTCGRCEIDVADIAVQLEEKMRYIDMPLKVAVMGCSVNGPGEARQADIGVAGGKKYGLLFRKGKTIARVPEKELLPVLLNEIEKIANN